ncbi:DNA-3-methyladenine glycosylase I [Weissella soli]|uniref:DNA-3-methyladenine glycosylase I n=1 Tax=Weissella soli TaxID=155866 RepID=UPI003C77231A
MTDIVRCAWVNNYKQNDLMTAYHDNEWGRPFHGDDNQLFELLTLEIFQAGLSWETILNKRANFNAAFANFDVDRVASFTEIDFERLIADAGIIRNQLKIKATINNARVIQAMHHRDENFVDYMWQFTEQQVIDHAIVVMADIPAKNALSEKVAKQMKHDGFKFTGPTSMYSFLQGMGVINDHEINCAFNLNHA